jgi:hypothetical protein
VIDGATRNIKPPWLYSGYARDEELNWCSYRYRRPPGMGNISQDAACSEEEPDNRSASTVPLSAQRGDTVLLVQSVGACRLD